MNKVELLFLCQDRACLSAVPTGFKVSHRNDREHSIGDQNLQGRGSLLDNRHNRQHKRPDQRQQKQGARRERVAERFERGYEIRR
jgi:hypothetical protein